MMWPILIIWFLVWETISIATKEKYFPTLSRWTWRQTARWKIKLDPPICVLGKCIDRILPLRIVLFIGMTWGTIHLSFGECAFGLC